MEKCLCNAGSGHIIQSFSKQLFVSLQRTEGTVCWRGMDSHVIEIIKTFTFNFVVLNDILISSTR